MYRKFFALRHQLGLFCLESDCALGSVAGHSGAWQAGSTIASVSRGRHNLSIANLRVSHRAVIWYFVASQMTPLKQLSILLLPSPVTRITLFHELSAAGHSAAAE
jgi:hypothetical protein